MTLNTFHNAGISDKNVTLGVPRLKEVINVAKTIKTPSLTIYLQQEFKMDKANVQKIQGLIEYTTLNHVVKQTGIYYDPDPERTIVKEDEELLKLYYEIPLEGEVQQNFSPWVIRMTIDEEQMI